jgi:two-component system chemotaxis response regulator CheY
MSEPCDLDGLRILIVDDDATMRALVCRMLKRMKVSGVAEADGGEQALERIAALRGAVDLVICDWNMPGMSGMELFQRVNADRPRLPFLMLTGRADLDSVIAAKKAGVPGYIVKPISCDGLKTEISLLLEKSVWNG